MSKLLEFFEAVAEIKNIELENAPRRMLEDLNGFCSVINDWVNEEHDCVSIMAQNYKVKNLIDRIPSRLQLTEQLKKYADLDKFSGEKLWTTYKVVVPSIGSSGLPKTGLTPEMKETVQDFRIRYLEEEQQTTIKAL